MCRPCVRGVGRVSLAAGTAVEESLRAGQMKVKVSVRALSGAGRNQGGQRFRCQLQRKALTTLTAFSCNDFSLLPYIIVWNSQKGI